MPADHVIRRGGRRLDLRIGGARHAGAAVAARQCMCAIAAGIGVCRVGYVLGSRVVGVHRHRATDWQEEGDRGEQAKERPRPAQRACAQISLLDVLGPDHRLQSPFAFASISPRTGNDFDLDQDFTTAIGTTIRNST
jgi:hypothetical protein